MLRTTLAAPTRTRATVAAVVTTLSLAAAAPAVAAAPAPVRHASDAAAGPVKIGIGGPCKGDESADFRGKGDRPHIAGSRRLPYISVHGFWVKCRPDARGALAKITVDLQQYRNGWVTVATGQNKVPAGGGAGKRATAQGRCHTYRGKRYRYRARVDVDIIGYVDSKEKSYGPIGQSNCSVLGR